jgi:hypothetical protein
MLMRNQDLPNSSKLVRFLTKYIQENYLDVFNKQSSTQKFFAPLTRHIILFPPIYIGKDGIARANKYLARLNELAVSNTDNTVFREVYADILLCDNGLANSTKFITVLIEGLCHFKNKFADYQAVIAQNAQASLDLFGLMKEEKTAIGAFEQLFKKDISLDDRVREMQSKRFPTIPNSST